MVDDEEPRHMLVEKVLAGNFVGNDLGKDGSGQVRNCLACFMHEVPSGGLRRDEIAAMVRMAA
jgi:hypothetical protein